MSSQDSKLTTSDTELIESARSGDTSAFAELWRRHYRSAARVARQFTSSIDADDLVSEAYARIFQRVLAGGGPTGAFRPYLYTTIRNLASSWGAASRDVQVDVIEEFEDERIPDDPAAWALDRTLTAKAFRSLPDRWQTVLWYTEVEGMDPHEVAPLMGLTANGVAALSYRAREGLRTAWLQAHISNAGTSTDCQWTMARLGDRARNGPHRSREGSRRVAPARLRQVRGDLRRGRGGRLAPGLGHGPAAAGRRRWRRAARLAGASDGRHGRRGDPGPARRRARRRRRRRPGGARSRRPLDGSRDRCGRPGRQSRHHRGDRRRRRARRRCPRLATGAAAGHAAGVRRWAQAADPRPRPIPLPRRIRLRPIRAILPIWVDSATASPVRSEAL